jgi:hypothetical protein
MGRDDSAFTGRRLSWELYGRYVYSGDLYVFASKTLRRTSTRFQTNNQYINNHHRYLKIGLSYAMHLGALIRMS